MKRKLIIAFLIFIVKLCPVATDAFSPLSPYSYCGGNPVNYIDPTGGVIVGVTKKDAAMAVEDFKEMFPGNEFANFRNLIVQSGKSFAAISADALSAAFSGVGLNESQQALVDMVVNTINSKDVHKVEYIQGTGVLSSHAEASFLPPFMNGEIGPFMPQILEANGGLPVLLIMNEGGRRCYYPNKKRFSFFNYFRR